MLSRIFNRFSLRTCSHQKSKVMTSRPRYLPNVLPDYQFGGQTSIPSDDIQSKIELYLSDITKNFEATERNGKDGLYLGSGGIAYMFYHLSKNPALHESKDRHIKLAQKYIAPALKVCTYETNSADIPAFMLGNCGIYAVASAIFNASGNKQDCIRFRNMYYEAASICKNMAFLPAGSDELFVGRAGYVTGALWMSQETNIPFKTEEIYNICRVMISSGKNYAESNKSQVPLMYSYYDVEYLGAAHGVSTILLSLLSVPGYMDGNIIDTKDIKTTIDYILSLQDNEGNFPAATDEIRNQTNELVHWCHGAGGIVYLMAKAYLLWNEDKYLDSCKKAADLIWEKGLLRKGPGICHGVAGNGYVFLLLYRLTNDKKYLHRAVQFASFLQDPEFKNKARVPDNPYSLFEGTAGTVCYLADLLYPEKASFPFCDVF